jgi:hypothetical protein
MSPGGRRGDRRRGDEHPILAALRFFRRGVAAQARLPLYECLLAAMIADVEADGVCAELLADPGPDPIEDAVPLRFLGAVHRLVLESRAPALAAFYPSAGGSFRPRSGPAAAEAMLATVVEHRSTVADGLTRPVQTNEVGRCRALMLGFLDVAHETGRPLRMLEIGASAGLNLRWDRYRYEGGAGATAFGPVNSPVRLEPAYRDQPPDLGRLAVVVERRGCDASPLDPTSPSDQLTLRSFVWPEQTDRLARLAGAFEVARGVAAPIDRADAAEWLDDRLADDDDAQGAATVVYHSIVWQYLSGRTRSRLVAALAHAGRSATEQAPLAWVRMEPAGGDIAAKATEIRVTRWPGEHDEVIGHAGYHGQWVQAASNRTDAGRRSVSK